MKRTLFVMVFFANITLSLGKITDDSLKKIVRNNYLQYLTAANSSYFQTEVSNNNVGVQIQELFKDCFDGARFFKVDYTIIKPEWVVDDFPSYCRFYVFDTIGHVFRLADDAAFKSLIRSAKFQVINLDQCYLYLYLVANETGSFSRPEQYEKVLKDGSVFRKYGANLFGYLGSNASIPLSQIREDLEGSSRNKVYVYVIRYDHEKFITRRYCFFFAQGKYLQRIEVEEN